MSKSSSGSRRLRDERILTAVPAAAKLCGTCAFWGGSRKIARRGFIYIHPYSKGGCQGPVGQHLETAALAACSSWQLWSVLDGADSGRPGQEAAV